MPLPRPEMVLHPDFLGQATKLDGALTRRVLIALQQFAEDPNHSSLNLHPIEGDRSGRLHTIRVNRDVRVLLSKQGNIYTALDTDHHDALYARALRGRFLTNPSTGYIGFAEPTSDVVDATEAVDGTSGRRQTAQTEVERRPFDHWTDAELLEVHLDDQEVAALRACADESDVCDLADLLDEETMDLVFELFEKTPEQYAAQTLDPEADAEDRLRRAIAANGATNGLSQVLSAEEILKLASAPIEEWMVFLHPDQRAAANRRYDGPARVSGSAGTGKTVVGLHRAAALARRFEDEEDDPRPILFTTFIKSLPPVFENLYARLPGSQPGRVEFIHIDKLAARVCRDASQPARVDSRSVDAAFAKAWRATVTPGTPLASLGLSKQYVRDEVTAVVKGRRIGSLPDYLDVARTGRRTRVTAAHRAQVWLLKEAWDEEMAVRGTVDFVDVLVRASEIAGSLDEPPYRAAIIDEAQDLSLAGLDLVRALVNGAGDDPPDGLFIVGDGAQRIYPGGFTLRQAGLEVRGRTTVLRTNYRNTAEIIASAMAVAGDEEIDDLGDEQRRGDAPADADRDGARPHYIGCGSLSDQLVEAIRLVEAATEGDAGVDLGDIAVCAPTNPLVSKVEAALGRAKVPFVDLKRYEGRSAPQVKVGTFHRAKGLEFKMVLLVGLGEDEFPRWFEGQEEAEAAESVSMQIGSLFVAMTRARDQLVLLGTGDPCEPVARAGEAIDTTTT